MSQFLLRLRRALLACALAATGCSGGGSASFAPRGVATAVPSGQVRVTAQIAGGELPLLSAKSRATAGVRRRAIASSYQSLVFTGTIYPGYAGTATQTVSSTVNTTTLPSAVGLAFSNVATGNNEWVVIAVTAFTGQNGMGSSTPAGELGGLFNVGSNASVTVDNGSTLRLQLALAGMMDGLISTYELANQTSLDSDLGNFIGQSGASTDSNSGLYSETTLTRLLQNLVSGYQRQVTVTGSISGPSTAYATWDYTNAQELNYSTSVTDSIASLTPFDVSLIHFPTIVANPNAGLLNDLATGVPPHVPSATGTGLQRAVISTGFDAPSGTATITQIYGGALRVGVGTDTSPPSGFASRGFGGYGGFASVAGRARASATTANVSVAPSEIKFTQNDPEGAYLNVSLTDNLSIPYGERFAPIDNVFELNCESSLCRGSTNFVSNGGGSDGTGDGSLYVVLDQFNPWALPTSAFSFCITASAECFPFTAGSTITTHTPFYADPTQFYSWPITEPSSGAGATSSVTDDEYDPYEVAYTGSSTGQTNGYVDFDLGTGVAYFYGGQQLQIATTIPNDSTLYFDIGCGGTTYQYSSVVENGSATISISSFSGLVTCQSVTLGYSIPTTSNGTFTFGPILPPAVANG